MTSILIILFILLIIAVVVLIFIRIKKIKQHTISNYRSSPKNFTKWNQKELEIYKKNQIKKIDYKIKEIKKDKYEKARHLILNAIEDICVDITNETSTEKIKIPNEKIKGKIIGKNGNSINHFMSITNTNIYLPDDALFVIISCFNPLDKKIAISTMQHMIKSDAFDILAINNIYKKEKDKILSSLSDIGREYTVNKLGFDINPGLYRYIGALFYRTSYSQNVLQHCYECALIAKNIAKQLHLDEKLAAMCGFFHDIGKSADCFNETKKDHIDYGLKLAIDYKLPIQVQKAIKLHHTQKFNYTYDSYLQITFIADKISAGRTAARSTDNEIFQFKKTIKEILFVNNLKRYIKFIDVNHLKRRLSIIISTNKKIKFDDETRISIINLIYKIASKKQKKKIDIYFV